MTVLVEGFDSDAMALARLLAAEGETVRLAGPAGAPANTAALESLGIDVEPHTNLDVDPGPAEIAYLDVWTPDVAPRVQRLRDRGTQISCLADLLLERWPGPSIGITGTAGKTSTTALAAQILEKEGIDIAVSGRAIAANLWPTGDLLESLRTHDQHEDEDTAGARTLLLELTSSHLAFMRHSPTVAAVISFWPDHLELHGSFARYRAAKETIVRHQREEDLAIVNADDASAGFAVAAPAATAEFSLRQPVERGAYLDPTCGVVLVDSRGEVALGPIDPRVIHPSNALAAAAIAAAVGAAPAAIEHGLRTATPVPWRRETLPPHSKGILAGVHVVDDGMAATPLKTAATLATYADCSVVLIAGGSTDAGGGPVHATLEEQLLLERACDEVVRTARAVFVFGEAASPLTTLLEQRRVETTPAVDLAEAIALAASRARCGAYALVFSPMFPLPHDERARFRELVRAVE